MAEPSVGVPVAKSVPVRSPLSSGRNATEKLQLALGARPAQGAPLSTNWRGSAIASVSDFAVRLSMVNCRDTPIEPVACGPYSASSATISSPSSSVVYAPVSGTV